jgi:hypothetical protein
LFIAGKKPQAPDRCGIGAWSLHDHGNLAATGVNLPIGGYFNQNLALTVGLSTGTLSLAARQM